MGHKREVRRSVGSVIQKYTESMKQEDSKGEAKRPSKPYLWDTRGVYKSEISNGLAHVSVWAETTGN